MSERKLPAVVQEYLLPNVTKKRQWSLFAFIRILPGVPNRKPERFVEFLRHLMGEPGKAITELDLQGLDEAIEGGELDVNDFFRQGLLGVLAHEFIRVNLLGGLAGTSQELSKNGNTPYPLLRARSDSQPDALDIEWEPTQSNQGSTTGAPRSKKNVAKLSLDAVDIAFTYSGLAALNIDKQTLASFPEAFRQGMAARTHLTGDGDLDAAESWDGVLGQDSVHALLTIHFPISENRFHYWDNLDKEVGQFNLDEWQWPAHEESPVPLDRKTQEDKVRSFFGALAYPDSASGANTPSLRQVVNQFAAHFGFEILQLELGQVPYELDHQQPCQPAISRS